MQSWSRDYPMTDNNHPRIFAILTYPSASLPVSLAKLCHHVTLDLFHSILVSGFVCDIHLAVGVESAVLWWAVSVVMIVVVVVVVSISSAATAISIVVVVTTAAIVVIVPAIIITSSVPAIIAPVASPIIPISSSIVVTATVVIVDVHIPHLGGSNTRAFVVCFLLVSIPVMARVSSILAATVLIRIAVPAALIHVVIVVTVAASRVAVAIREVVGRPGVAPIRRVVATVVRWTVVAAGGIAGIVSRTSSRVTVSLGCTRPSAKVLCTDAIVTSV